MKLLALGAALCVAAFAVMVGVASAAPIDLLHHVGTAFGAGDLAMACGLAIPLNARARGLVAVRADAGNAKAAIEEMLKTFEAFKAAHKEELDGIKKNFADVVTTDKVARINDEIGALQKSIDQMNAALAAMKVGGAGDDDQDPARREYAAAFDRFFRKGVDAGLQELAVKAALSTDSNPDGGYTVTPQMESAIDRVLATVSAIRSLARVITISTGSYKKLVNLGGAGAGWVGEREGRPETGTATLAQLEFPAMELYANPAATQTALDDSALDLAQWIADEVSVVFAEKEGAAFVSGDGVNKPRGFLNYTTVANASYAWGKLGYVASGVAAALTDGSNNGTEKLIDLYYSLKAGYRNGATWVMSDATMGTVRKFKDGDGNYIWAPPTGAGEMATVLGKPVQTDDNMNAIGANAFPIAFGNFQRGYLVVDRTGVRVLRDPYTNKPFVHFYTTKRVGGGVSNFEAIKLLKVATS